MVGIHLLAHLFAHFYAYCFIGGCNLEVFTMLQAYSEVFTLINKGTLSLSGIINILAHLLHIYLGHATLEVKNWLF